MKKHKLKVEYLTKPRGTRVCVNECVAVYVQVRMFVCMREKGMGGRETKREKEGGREREILREMVRVRIQSQVPLMPTQLCSTKAILGSPIFLQVH